MRAVLYKTARVFLRSALWAASLLILLAILIQLAMGGALLWLGSAGGRDWVRAQAQAALAGSGYTLVYGDLLYTGGHGLVLTDMQLSDARGPVVTADRIALHFAWLPLLERRLILSAEGGTIAIDHLPAGQDKPQEEAARTQGIALPDLFFRRLSIRRLQVARLALGEDVLGHAMILSPDLRADLRLNRRRARGRIELDLAQIEGTDIGWLPQKFAFEGALRPAAAMLDVKTLAVSAPAYSLSAQGLAALQGDAPLSLTIEARADHPEKLAPGMEGRAAFKAALSGTAADPVLKAEGTASFEKLKQRGLGDIALAADLSGLRGAAHGTVSLSSAYKDMPATLSAALAYDKPRLALTHIAGSAPGLALSGDVTIDTDTLLAAGSLSASAADLSPYADLAGVRLQGKGEFGLTLSHPQEKQAAGITAALGGIRYDNLTLARLKAAADFADIASPWPGAADIYLQGLHTGALDLDSLAATVKRKAQEDSYRLSLTAQGDYGERFRLGGGADIGSIATGTPDLSNIDITLKSGGNSLAVTGRADRESLDIKAAAKRLTLRALPLDLPPSLRRARITGSLRVHGALAAPQAAADIHLSPAAHGRQAVPDFAIRADYKDGAVKGTLSGSGAGIKSLTGNFSLPADIALQPFRFSLPPSTPLSGEAALRCDGSALQGFLPSGMTLSGAIEALAKIGGTLASPAIDGSASLANGSLRDESSGAAMNALALDAGFTQSALTLRKFSAKDDGDGTADGKGAMALDGSGESDLGFAFHTFHLAHNEIADLYLTGDLALRREKGQLVLSGKLDPGQTSITIPERIQSAIPQLNIVHPGRDEEEAATPLALDIAVSANNRIFVRGWGLDAEFGGDIAVTGTVATPLMNGTLSSIRGLYEEFGRRFTLDHANLRFQGEVPPSPYLDVQANLAASDIVASVRISGPAKLPVLSFSSTPALPQDEILSRILFGRNVSDISPFQAIQLEQSLRRFSGKGGSGLDPLGALRSATGLDDLSVDSSADSGTTVGAGKYITDKVYIGVQHGESETSGAANIKVDVTPNIAVDSRVGQDAQGGAGVSWHWDY